jgi:hypothetical protein
MADKSKALTFGHDCAGSIGGNVLLVTQESLKAENAWDEPSETAMIGTDKPGKDGRQIKKIDVKGSVTVRPSYAQASALLALFLDNAAGVHTPAANPTAKVADVVLDRGVDIYTYAACWLAALEISGQENEPLDWILELLGTTEADSGSVAALTPPDRMRFADLSACSIGGNNYFPSGFKFRLDNALEERFLNSLVRSTVQKAIQKVELELAFDQNADTFADLLALAGTNTPLAVSLTFTDGVHSLAIACLEMTVVNPAKWPDGAGVESRKDTLKLRAWLKTGESHICTLTYT